MDTEKKKKGSQGNREMKDVEGNEELQEKPECLSNKGREIEKRWMKRVKGGYNSFVINKCLRGEY